MAVSVLVNIVLRNGLAPGRAALELDMVDVDTGIDNVNVNALTAFRFVLVESEGSEAESLAVRNTRKTLKATSVQITRPERVRGTYPWSKTLGIQGVNNGVLFDISNLRHLSDTLNDGVGETASVAFEVTVVHLTNTDGSIGEEGVFLVSGLEEVEMVAHGGRVEVILQHDNVRVVKDLVRVLSLEGMEGGEGERGPLYRDIMRGR